LALKKYNQVFSHPTGFRAGICNPSPAEEIGTFFESFSVKLKSPESRILIMVIVKFGLCRKERFNRGGGNLLGFLALIFPCLFENY